MIFRETALKGAFVIEPKPVRDERGLFARTWCQKEFEAQGLSARWVQSSISLNSRRGTMRGMHYQAAPNEEVKLVRCTAGAIYDVIVDLRPTAPTYGQHVGITLTAGNHCAVYIPEQFAHGFLTLEDESEVSYHMSEFYAPSSARGIRWDDPALNIQWPEPILIVSKKDQMWPPFILNA
ncbi:MAG: dTDP-4-dehydrorhamnose 3,5-epimerase [Nitrospira sp.]